MVLNSVVARYSVWLSLCGADRSAPRFVLGIMSKRSYSDSFADRTQTTPKSGPAVRVGSDVAMHVDLFPELRDAVQQDLDSDGASRPSAALGPDRGTGELGASRPMPMLQSPHFSMPCDRCRPDEASRFKTTDTFLCVRTDSVGMETIYLDRRRTRSEESLDLEHQRYNDGRSVLWGDRHIGSDDPYWRQRWYAFKNLPQRRE